MSGATNMAQARVIIGQIREAAMVRRLEARLVESIAAKLANVRLRGSQEATSRILNAVRRLPKAGTREEQEWRVAIYETIIKAGVRDKSEEEAS